MDAKRFNMVLLGALALMVVALAGSVYGANGLLEKQAERLHNAKLDSMVLDEKQRQLAKAQADIKKYEPLAGISQHIVPQDKDQAQTVREIVSIANASGVKLGAITFPTSSLGGTTPAAKSKPALSQLRPVKNLSGVYLLELTVQSDTATPAPYASVIKFLDALERNRRTALVSSISLQPDANNPGKLSFTLNLNEYIRP